MLRHLYFLFLKTKWTEKDKKDIQTDRRKYN